MSVLIGRLEDWSRHLRRDYPHRDMSRLQAFLHRLLLLPQLLKGFGIFGSVDTTKIQNYNSEDHDISELHYEPHKGMGMKALVITDLTGEPIYCDFNLNGAAYDGNQVLV